MTWTLSSLHTGSNLESPHRRDFVELGDAIAEGERLCDPEKFVRPIRAWVHRKGKPLGRAKWEHKAKMVVNKLPSRR